MGFCCFTDAAVELFPSKLIIINCKTIHKLPFVSFIFWHSFSLLLVHSQLVEDQWHALDVHNTIHCVYTVHVEKKIRGGRSMNVVVNLYRSIASRAHSVPIAQPSFTENWDMIKLVIDWRLIIGYRLHRHSTRQANWTNNRTIVRISAFAV